MYVCHAEEMRFSDKSYGVFLPKTASTHTWPFFLLLQSLVSVWQMGETRVGITELDPKDLQRLEGHPPTLQVLTQVQATQRAKADRA